MMDEPVQWESSSSMNLNSELDQRMNSSDKRLRCIIRTAANSRKAMM